jgi:exodeoxyribonuclease VII small subunit
MAEKVRAARPADSTGDGPASAEAAAPTPSEPHADVAAMGYEQARDELVALVARLESGQVGLEESMQLWERGEALATHCSTWLDRAEERISAQD